MTSDERIRKSRAENREALNYWRAYYALNRGRILAANLASFLI
jgi:hypothetical protein